MTEDSLRQLKAHVTEAVAEYKKTSQSVKASSNKGSQVSQKELKERDQDAKSNRSGAVLPEDQKSNISKSKQSSRSGTSSETSSIASKSVYAV